MQKKRWVWLGVAALAIVIVIVAVFGIRALRVEFWDYGFDRDVSEPERQLRLEFVSSAEKWLGTCEGSQEHKDILAIYNNFKPLAQGYTVKDEDNWCATYVSTVAIECNLTGIIPTECGCQRQIGLFQELGRWEESDDYTPLPGDIIYYCGGDKDPFSDCTGWSDHVGIVVGSCNGYLKVIEGNCNNRVAYRYIRVNSTGIRGFALPEYDTITE